MEQEDCRTAASKKTAPLIISRGPSWNFFMGEMDVLLLPEPRVCSDSLLFFYRWIVLGLIKHF